MMKYKPHILMMMAQFGYSILFFLMEAAFNNGMNPHVFVAYRHVVASILISPFAYFIEKNKRPKLTFLLFGEIFILSMLGIFLALNLYFASFRYTSPAFVAAMLNTIAPMTFLLAVIFRLEVVNIKNHRGIAKVIGTLVSLAGVTTITLYKGPVIKNIWKPLINIQGKQAVDKDWSRGCLLAISSCIAWSLWYIMQAYSLQRYPAQLSLTTWMNFVGGAQSAVLAVIIVPNKESWKIGLNIELISILYAGVVCSGIINFIKLWCTDTKGPVFVTMFTPVNTVLVSFLAYFIIGQKLSLGSILGALIVIIGLYLLLWGKEADPERKRKVASTQAANADEEANNSMQVTTART